MSSDPWRLATRFNSLVFWFKQARQALFMALAGLLISLMAYGAALRLDTERVDNILQFRAEWRMRDMAAKLQLAAAPLQATASFISSQDDIFPAELQPFVRELSRGSGLASVGWVPWVSHADRDGFERYAAASWRPGYQILERGLDGDVAPAAARGVYAPVLFMQALEGEEMLAPGLDLLRDPLRGDLLRRAAAAGRPLANVVVHASAISMSEPRRHLVVPVYSSGLPTDTPELRQAALLGFVVGEYNVTTLLRLTMQDTPAIPEVIRFHVGEGRLVAAYDPALDGFLPASAIARHETPNDHPTALGFNDFDLPWRLDFYFPSDLVSAIRSSGPLVLLLASLLLTVLLSGYVLRQQAVRREVEELVERRTADLSAANATLHGEVEERRRVEGMLREQADNLNAGMVAVPVAILYLDPQRRILYWSPAARRIFGYGRQEMLNKRLALAPAEDAAVLEAAIDRLVGGERVKHVPLRLRHRDGRVLDVEFSGAPVFAGKELRGMVAVLEDVTQRKATEAQLLQAQKMDALGQLTGGLAHDFNNLLLVIVGNLQLLQARRGDDELVMEFTEQAHEAAMRGAELVRSLLAFARRQPLQPRAMDINNVVSDMTRMLARVLGQRIEVNLQLASDPWPVLIDPVQLEAALANLATNARDAMPRGGRLTIATANRHLDDAYVSLHADVTAGDYTMLQVSDTGEGMAPEVMARIFEPFFTTKEAGRGSGLGLSMVFGFMKQSGGHINVYSEVGVGTTFRLYLPRYYQQATIVPAQAQTAPSGGGSETILVVEDDEALRRLALRQIASLGYQVLEAENAAAALAQLETGVRVDLMFSDVVMAGKLDGLDLVRLVPQRWPQVKVVLTSGFPDANIPLDPDDPCAPRLLSKPYRREELARLLREMLDCDRKKFVAPR